MTSGLFGILLVGLWLVLTVDSFRWDVSPADAGPFGIVGVLLLAMGAVLFRVGKPEREWNA